MTKIQTMYKWSGGTDYGHTCYECRNCKKFTKGSRCIYKCLAYGNTDSAATDWKGSFIACRHFNKPVPERPVLRGIVKRRDPNEELTGQMSLEDFPEVMP